MFQIDKTNNQKISHESVIPVNVVLFANRAWDRFCLHIFEFWQCLCNNTRLLGLSLEISIKTQNQNPFKYNHKYKFLGLSKILHTTPL